MSPGPPNNIDYRCSNCQRPTPRADLLARRVTYSTIKPVKMIRSRVVGWWCKPCRETDPAWTSSPHVSSPGMIEQRKKEDVE